MKNKRLFLYASSFLFAFHWYLILYLNSSYLGEFVSEKTLSGLYLIGAIITLFSFLIFPAIMRKTGLRALALVFLGAEAIAVLLMAIGKDPILVGAAFIIHSVLMPMILFSLDIFLEKYTDEETITGGVRSTFLTLSNIPLVIAPLIMGAIIASAGIRSVYIYSLIFLIPLAYIFFRHLGNIKPTEVLYSFRGSLNIIRTNKDIRNILIAHQLLQLYYAFMVIYTPLYLSEYIGFDWATIGILFSIMLLPFILFEIPAGKLADTRLGEKEMLIGGFIVMAIATVGIYAIAGMPFAVWAAVLFMTRVGAALVEVTSESYFFKHMKDSDSGIISLFRATRPVSFILAPLIATIVLSVSDFKMIFFVLAIVMLMGTIPSMGIKDTR